MHYLPLVGMVLLAAGIVVFRIALPANQPLVLVASALTGLALGEHTQCRCTDSCRSSCAKQVGYDSPASNMIHWH